MSQLYQTPVAVRRLKVSGERLEVRVVATGFEMLRDPPRQPSDVPLRVDFRLFVIEQRVEDQVEKSAGKGEDRIRQNAVVTRDGLRDPSLHAGTLHDDAIGRERIPTRGHQASRQALEESFRSIAAFDEKQDLPRAPT